MLESRSCKFICLYDMKSKQILTKFFSLQIDPIVHGFCLCSSHFTRKIKQQALLFVPEASSLIQTFLALVSGSSWHITMQVGKPTMTDGHENDYANRASTLYVACKNPIRTRFFFSFSSLLHKNLSLTVWDNSKYSEESFPTQS